MASPRVIETGFRRGGPDSAGGLVKPALFTEPSFGKQKHQGKAYQEQAEQRGRLVIKTTGDLLINGVGKGLKAQKRDRPKIRHHVKHHEKHAGHQGRPDEGK